MKPGPLLCELTTSCAIDC